MHPTITDGIRATLPDPEWVRLPFAQRVYGISVAPEVEGYRVSVTLAVWQVSPGMDLPGDLSDVPRGVEVGMWARWPNLEFRTLTPPEEDARTLQDYLGPLDVARFWAEEHGYMSWIIKPQVYQMTAALGGDKWDGPLYVAPIAREWAKGQPLALVRTLPNGAWEMRPA
jgi:hypothetical protein